MADCKTCKETRAKKPPESVPYLVHEQAMVRNERSMKRMVVALIVAIALMFASNACWLWAWCQYDYESYEITADGDSNANYIGQDGVIYNGGTDFGEKEGG